MVVSTLHNKQRHLDINIGPVIGYMRLTTILLVGKEIHLIFLESVSFFQSSQYISNLHTE